MEIQIRKAVREDCEAIMKMVNELAVFEKAPEEVTVTMEHFIESGFGEKPVWEAFVASPNPSQGGEQAKMEAEDRHGDNSKERSEYFRSNYFVTIFAISSPFGGDRRR